MYHRYHRMHSAVLAHRQHFPRSGPPPPPGWLFHRQVRIDGPSIDDPAQNSRGMGGDPGIAPGGRCLRLVCRRRHQLGLAKLS
jgi:hypothetical protein